MNARIEVKAYASTSYASERVALFTCANPSAATPVWTWATTLYPSRAGAQVLVGTIPVTAGTQAVRAHMFKQVTGTLLKACGTTGGTAVTDDQDDLVFKAAP